MFKHTVLLSLALIAVSITSADAKAESGRARVMRASQGCTSFVPLGNLIWKGCAGSGHLSQDPRGKGVALIAKQGSKIRPGFRCLPILNEEFKQLTGIQLYPGNNPRGPYSWRAYSNFGCGRGVTQSKLKQLSKGKPIFIKLNSRGQCIRLEKAFVNINSSQRC